MQYYKNITQFVSEKQVFCGIDVHDKHWTIAFFCDGDTVEKIQIQPVYEALLNHLKPYCRARSIRFVYEAGFSGFVLYRQLTNDNYSCIVTPPSRIPTIGQKVKTDKRDAAKLASFLAADLLKSVYVPPANVESDRRIVRRRAQLVRSQTRAKNQISAFLKLFGLKPPSDVNSRWSKKHLRWIDSIAFDHESDGFTCKLLLANYQRLRLELYQVNQYIRKLSKHALYCDNFQIVTSVRGVGLITGMTFLLELNDMSRFKNSNAFSSFLGMTPSQFSSGEHVRLGHITREGNAQLRRVLVESAWTVIRHDPILRDKYNRLRARGTNGKKAIVAVARSLAVRLRRCLLDKTPYVIGVE
jgi:transposase